MHHLQQIREQVLPPAATQEAAEALRDQRELPRVPVALPDALELAAGDFGEGNGSGVHFLEHLLGVVGAGGDRNQLVVEACESEESQEEGTVENVADRSEVGIVAVENQLVGVYAVQSAVSTSNSKRRATSR